MANQKNERWKTPLQEEEGSRIPEERLLRIEDEEEDVEEELSSEDVFDTQQGEGHTYNVHTAMDQGLTYTPPTDPPIEPSRDDPSGVEMAAGFAPSMEEAGPDVEDLPPEIESGDLELEDEIVEMLHYNGETQNLDDIRVRVGDGVVALLGTVPSEDDLARVYNVVREIEGVTEIRSYLQVES